MPSEGFLISPNKSFYSDISKRLNNAVLNLEERERRGDDFLGFLNGYGRPYHYFYDRGPSLRAFSDIDGLKVIDLFGSAFISAERYGFEVNDVVLVKNPNDLDGVFA